MDIAKLFFVDGVAVVVVAMPTILVWMAFITRDRQPQPVRTPHAREGVRPERV